MVVVLTEGVEMVAENKMRQSLKGIRRLRVTREKNTIYKPHVVGPSHQGRQLKLDILLKLDDISSCFSCLHYV
jgi:hypothetical protein